MLTTDLGLANAVIQDPRSPFRPWMIHALYTPIPGRALGGIRAKLVDAKGFITFCNQRDLEVLLGYAKPGDWCRWAGQEYVGSDDRTWYGLCADEDDLRDDLQERELLFRAQYEGGVLAPPLEFTRRVHLDAHMDFEELYMLFRDFDVETGFYPDLRLETIDTRWSRSHRERLLWERI